MLLWIPPPWGYLALDSNLPAWAKRGRQAFDVSGLVGSTRGRVRQNEGEAAGRGRGAGDEGRQREKGKDMDWTIERRENTNKGREWVYVDRQEKEEGALKLWSYGPSKDLPPQSHTGGGSNRKERMAGGEERWWIMMGWISSSGPLSVYFLHFTFCLQHKTWTTLLCLHLLDFLHEEYFGCFFLQTLAACGSDSASTCNLKQGFQHLQR